MAIVSASLLAADFVRMAEDVERVLAAGVDSLHIDFMDGHYVPNLALTPYHLELLSNLTDLPLEVHLEVANPDTLLDSFHPFPATMLIPQWDTCPDPAATIARVRSRGVKAALGLLPLAEIDPIVPVLGQIEMLVLLGVKPGFGGQAMVEGTLEWLENCARLRDQYAPHLPLAIDGGVSESNGAELVRAGADVLIVGTSLFQSPDMASMVRALHRLVR